jgi:hypothetical protein
MESIAMTWITCGKCFRHFTSKESYDAHQKESCSTPVGIIPHLVNTGKAFNNLNMIQFPSVNNSVKQPDVNLTFNPPPETTQKPPKDVKSNADKTPKEEPVKAESQPPEKASEIDNKQAELQKLQEQFNTATADESTKKNPKTPKK